MNHRPAFAHNETKSANRVALLPLYSATNESGGERGREQRFAKPIRAGVRGCRINRLQMKAPRGSHFVTIASRIKLGFGRFRQSLFPVSVSTNAAFNASLNPERIA